jgi:hypothetical protein
MYASVYPGKKIDVNIFHSLVYFKNSARSSREEKRKLFFRSIDKHIKWLGEERANEQQHMLESKRVALRTSSINEAVMRQAQQQYL